MIISNIKITKTNKIFVQVNRGLSDGDFDIEDYKFVVVATALKNSSGQVSSVDYLVEYNYFSDLRNLLKINPQPQFIIDNVNSMLPVLTYRYLDDF